ncbi:MAG: tetrahydrofolate dehydrogenase/cyclohydrolase catalytic domain-containing protein [Oscillospiraceae bacterium]
MAMLLKGADAARALTEQLREQAEELKKNGTEPCLAILRVGAREDDLSYERGALKRCEKVGITVRQVVLPEDAGQQELMDNIRSLNEDERVHGVLMFRPLPKHLDDEAARRALDPRRIWTASPTARSPRSMPAPTAAIRPAPPRPAWRCSSIITCPSRASAWS